MSNRGSSHQHGVHRMERRRPSTNQARKISKARARGRQIARQAAIREALAA